MPNLSEIQMPAGTSLPAAADGLTTEDLYAFSAGHVTPAMGDLTASEISSVTGALLDVFGSQVGVVGPAAASCCCSPCCCCIQR